MGRRVTYPRRDGFRETFLMNFTRKGDASGLRRLSSLISELHINASPLWWPRKKDGDLRTLLRACVRDMRHLEALLTFANPGRELHTMELGALANFARRCGGELGGLADAIEDAMAHPQENLERDRALLAFVASAGRIDSPSS